MFLAENEEEEEEWEEALAEADEAGEGEGRGPPAEPTEWCDGGVHLNGPSEFLLAYPNAHIIRDMPSLKDKIFVLRLVEGSSESGGISNSNS